jgi:chloramphenicol-sensitive protein RarD
MSTTNSNRGLAAVILAFAIWGLFPVYWKLLAQVDALELLFLRLVLTAGTCLILLPVRGSWPAFRRAGSSFPQLRTSALAAVLLSGNWFAFIWAVNTGNVLESSLGYFLCPILNILLGRLVENESMGNRQWLAVISALSGVLIIVMVAGRIPLAAIVIAVTWSGYGLMKKRSSLGPIVSLGLETSLLSPVALLAIIWLTANSGMTLPDAGAATLAFLTVSGALTAAPLLLFAYAAPRIRLTTMGMGQFIVPSAHFALAVLYGEQITSSVLAGFALIWAGLAIYAWPNREADSH